jgi:hypothetical protein
VEGNEEVMIFFLKWVKNPGTENMRSRKTKHVMKVGI